MEGHFLVFLFHDGQARRIECPETNPLAVFKRLSQQTPKLVLDKNLQSVILIDGAHGVHYDAKTVRWLCGCGPEPSGEDPDWLG